MVHGVLQVQGMSFIAAILLLNMDVADAFVCFANLLNRPCQVTFFRMDEEMVRIWGVGGEGGAPCSDSGVTASHWLVKCLSQEVLVGTEISGGGGRERLFLMLQQSSVFRLNQSLTVLIVFQFFSHLYF